MSDNNDAPASTSTTEKERCRCTIVCWSRDPFEPHIPAQPEWEQADDCPVHPLATTTGRRSMTMSENLTQTHTEYGVRFPDGHIEGPYLDRDQVPTWDGCTVVQREKYRSEWHAEDRA